jgi:TonB family protein
MSQRKNSADSDRLSDAGCTHKLSHWLIHRAARHTPDCLSQRMEEEWLADMAARLSAMSRLRFAVGCCWATLVIAHEHPSRMPVMSTVVGARPMIAFAHQNFGKFSRRSSTFFLVASLHVVVFYGLVSALTHTRTSAVPPPLQNREVAAPRLRELLPRLDPQMTGVTLDLQRPEFDIHDEPDSSGDVTANFAEEPSHPLAPPLPSESPAHIVKQVQGGPGLGFPDPDDFYPMLAKHLEEQGLATVNVCVAINGRLTANPSIVQGTGSARLDEAALKLARAGSGHYRASTEDGRPVNSCYALNIRFRLKN